MRIAVAGAGAMGSICGGHLSQHSEAYLVGTAAPVVEHIQKEELKPQENGGDTLLNPIATTSTEDVGAVDPVTLFVKALFLRAVLSSNGGLIKSDTYVVTPQNGSGHEGTLGEFADQNHVIIGTTEGNGTVLGLGHIRCSGAGNTNVGVLIKDKNGLLPELEEALDCCDFNVKIRENIQQLIWDGLFTNASLSVAIGVPQVDMGHTAANEYAWAMTTGLIREAVAVAKAMDLTADEEQIMTKVGKTSGMSPNGCTSTRADSRDGRRTEVDITSGSVIRVTAKVGVPVPSHELVVNMVHTLEDKN